MKGHWSILSGIDIGADGDPYLDRLRLLETPLFSIYLHHIHRPDKETDPHDHPWPFWSVVLCGGYSEVVWPDKENPGWEKHRRRGRWSLRRMPLRAAHIITRVTGPLWTLVITGRKRGTWGFYPGGHYVSWQEYFGPGYVASFEEQKAAGRSHGQPWDTMSFPAIKD